jgi:hypothetical protein
MLTIMNDMNVIVKKITIMSKNKSWMLLYIKWEYNCVVNKQK